MAYSVVALHVAAHNCDYYINKYACKALEQLQNLVTQYAIGIRRLEEDENLEAAAGVESMSTKARAKRVLIRLQNAANRCHWFSSTELAVFLKTGDTFWTSHNDAPVFISKLVFMLHECRRALEDRTPGLLEAADVSLQVIEFEASVPRVTGFSSGAPAEDEEEKEETGDSASEPSKDEDIENLEPPDGSHQCPEELAASP